MTHEHNHGKQETPEHGAPDEDLEIWGRESDHDDFMKGHYGNSRRQPTPEGGQAGIAQGNTSARKSRPRRVK